MSPFCYGSPPERLALTTDKLGDVSAGRCGQIGQKAIHGRLGGRGVVAGRHVNRERNAHGLIDVLTRHEGVRDERIDLESNAVASALPVRMSNAHEVRTSRVRVVGGVG